MKILLPLIQSLIFAACSATQSQVLTAVQNPPSCINDKIEFFKKEPKQNPPRSVTEYTYKGHKVYYIPAPCCDQYSTVFDSTCNLLGHPDGGITGKGDGKLPGFGEEAKDEKLIWKDDR
ncbi:MAG: hypothetical protein ABIN97_10040 [Ginsengibacter sp.]